MRSSLLSGLALAMLVAAADDARANRDGAQAGFNGSPASFGGSCMSCHGDAAGGGAVHLLGAPAAYEIGALYELTVRIEDETQVAAGFEVSVEDPGGDHVGTLIVSDPVNTQEAQGPAGWLTHTEAGVDAATGNWSALGNAAEYTFRWQAPGEDAGELTIYVAGNAINDDGGANGDLVYFTTWTIGAAAPCPADVTGDGLVAVDDLVAVIVGWGACPPKCPGDVTGDGQVDVQDLVEVITAWGPC